MAIGDRIRIVTEKDYRIMSPPSRPRGEKPRTTIRYLQRQIANMQRELLTWRDAIVEKDQQIAVYDVELSEAADRENILASQVEDSADNYGTLLAIHQRDARRLAYLEGYFYAKSTETIRGPSEGDSRAHPHGAPAGQEGEPENTAGGNGGAAGSQVRRFRPNDPAPHHRRSVDRAPIAGAAHDADPAELERHRR